MTPRKTQQGASASARRTPPKRGVRQAPSPATRANSGLTRAVRGRSEGGARPPKRQRQTAVARHAGSGYRWWLLPIVVVGVMGLFIAGYYPVARVEYRETREKAELQAELGAIQARNARLRSEVDRLKTPEGVEDYARRLGMAKKGEHVVVVDDGTESTRTSVAASVPEIDSQEAVKPPVGPWTAFLDAFFGVQ